MTALAKVRNQLGQLEVEQKKLVERQLEILRRTLIRCEKCKHRSRISAWIFIQEMWYVEPYSCNEGDYWKNSETESCDILCPKCDHRNYLHNHPQRDKIVGLVDKPFRTNQLFRSVHTEHSR